MEYYVDIARDFVNQHFKNQEPFQIVIQVIFGIFIVLFIKYLITNGAALKNTIMNIIFGGLKSIPGVQGQIDKEKESLKNKISKALEITGQEKMTVIPNEGLAPTEILRRMTEIRDKEEQNWKSNKVSGCVYSGDEKHTDLMIKAYSLFSITNPLHPDVFPSIRKFEAEVVRMTANMLGGDDNVVGAVTSGGTESILMAVKAYRDYYKKSNPEIVIPSTAHAAFDKAGSYFGIKVIHVPVDKNMLADVNAMAKAITKNTILLVGSAPQYPHGMVDPIKQLAALAQKHNIGCHTDACLGGYVLPWVKKTGITSIPDFDFSVPGVTSMSCDTHKYGFAAKGTSVVLFRGRDLRKAMFFVQPNWLGGMYASPTMAGSRPGGVIASCWASLIANGQKGYKEKARAIWDAAQQIKAGIKKIPELNLIGDSCSTVVAFGSQKLDIYKVSDAMHSKGWNLNNLMNPNCIHICVTLRHINMVNEFLNDLTTSVATIVGNPNAFPGGNAGVYGLAATLPDRSIVKDMGVTYLDAVLDV